MRRRKFIFLLGGAASWRLADGARAEAKAYRIGFLGSTNPSTYAKPISALRRGLRDLGYEEGRNLVIEYRWGEDDYDRLPALAAELVRLKVDLIVTHGTTGAEAALHATKTIPIVLATSGDPVRRGFVANLARPGGNITGLSIVSFELGLKRLELLKQAAPNVRHVAFLAIPGTLSDRQDSDYEVAAQTMSVRLQWFYVHGPRDFISAFEAMINYGVDGLVVRPNPPLRAESKDIAALALKHRLPAIAEGREFADAGGLLAYGVNIEDLFYRAASFVDKILRGSSPGNLPVEQPSKFELVVNLTTAKALGLSLSETFVSRADEVVE